MMSHNLLCVCASLFCFVFLVFDRELVNITFHRTTVRQKVTVTVVYPGVKEREISLIS